MPVETFRALVVREGDEGTFSRQIEERTIDDLPPGDLLIKVLYSSLNYKDALSATGHRGVTRHYPHTPGVDAAGEVVESSSPDFRPGDQVIVNGFDLGQNTAGGFGQYIRVPASWALPLPDGLTPRESMCLGTAGLTAALSVQRIVQNGVTPEQGDVLVTGASGGVGSMAVAILAIQGFRVIAATGKPAAAKLLTDLGAAEIVERSAVDDTSERPLLKGRWAAVVDTVGGNILATALKSTRPNGCVTACGNVASAELHTTVYPFILRGVSLLGIDAANSALSVRRPAWELLANAWKPPRLETLITECDLASLDGYIERILRGDIMGRVVVNLWG